MMPRIARIFAAVALLVACNRPADGPRPPLVALPPEIQRLVVYLDPQISWAAPDYVGDILDWGKKLMDELAQELNEHGFVVAADRQSGHELVLDVAIDAGGTIMSAMTVDLNQNDAEPGHPADKIAMKCGYPEYCARALTNQLVASPYFNELVRRHIKDRTLALRSGASMLVMPLKASGHFDPQLATEVSRMLVAQLDGVKQLRVVSLEDVETAISMERKKDALGCSDIACASEIGSALGSDLVLYGTVGSLGDQYNVALTVVDAKGGTVKGRLTVQCPARESAVAPALRQAARQLVDKLNGT